MVSFATLIEVMMLLFHPLTCFLLDSIEDSELTKAANYVQVFVSSHIVPSFLVVIGLIHVQPRQLVDQ